jgi:hypothetical protein
MTNAVNIAQGGSNNVTFRNRIINGAQLIAQRGTSFSNPNPGYTTDRWNCISYNTTATITQSSTTPAGFTNSWLQTIGTGSSSGAGSWEGVGQNIEANNVTDLGWGTANALSVTVSFWVRSSVTGIYNISVSNVAVQSLSGSSSYHYISTYTINSANTWEQKTITIPGPTSGSWNNSGTSLGLSLWFDLGSGTNYNSSSPNTWENGTYFRTSSATSQVSSVTGSTWYMTGAQLEAGTTASPFEYRMYTTELQLCQRYYSQAVRGAYPGSFAAQAYSVAGITCSLQFPVTMRATPTLLVYYNGTVNAVGNINTAGSVSITPGQTWWTANGLLGQQPSGSPFTVGMSYGFDYTASAEL